METITINTNALHISEEEFFNFCVQNRDLRIERDANQQIFIMSLTGGLTENRNSEIIVQLGIWNKVNKSGYIFGSSGGFIMSDGAMRSPDAAWIQKSKWDAIQVDDKKRFVHICPDFIIELKSESDSLKQLQDKMQEWIANGCRLGWLIDFENQNIFVYKPNRELQIIDSFDSPVSGEDVLSGFELNLKDIS